ncbi:uncharacterized protein LOC131049449 [Cryptomeria japonica]|uniref:uncharacterized protein LOC131049449 n=1 Tax=Cryptomeria japonica TaxID=3369 RepID=UPI0027DA2330|nr:uncharacterized protein LOC131049449 [Cryptomeria japonica]
MENESSEINCFVTCQSGDITTALGLQLELVDLSSLSATWEGRTCLDEAVVAADPDLLRELIAKLQDPGLLRKLPELISIIKMTNKNGETALHLAIRRHRVDLVKWLVDFDLGIRKYRVDLDKHLADLDFTLCNWEKATDPDMIRELEAKVRDIIRNTDNKGGTPLDLAARKYRVDLVKHLVDLDTNMCDCEDKKGETPLKMAIRMGFKEAVKLLINLTSNALHLVVELNQVKLVEFLIKENVHLSNHINQPYQHPHGKGLANKNKAENEDNQNAQPIVRQGDTPLHIAARNKYEHVRFFILFCA